MGGHPPVKDRCLFCSGCAGVFFAFICGAVSFIGHFYLCERTIMKNKTRQVALDDTDLAILALLQEDASISNAQLSERLSLSLTPCWRRRKRLEEEGVIKDYQANLDRKMLGLDIMAFVHVRFAIHTDHAPDAFEAVVKELPQVLSCHKITGDADYLLQVLAQDLDSYSEFVESVLRRQLGIASIQSILGLREVRAPGRVADSPRRDPISRCR